MQISRKKFIAVIVAAFLAGGVLTGGVFALSSGQSGYDKDKYAKLDEVYQQLDENYYKEADDEALIDGACKGLVEAMGDPYSAYMTETEYKNWANTLQGEYSGIGVTFTEDKSGQFIVVSVQEDSPAVSAGIEAGDIILKADGKTYDSLDLMANAIKGKEGTEVEVTYQHDGEEKTVTLTRKKIEQHSVSSEMLDDKTAYINITSFISNTSDDFKAALEEAESAGADKLVLDLRDNGGGLLTSCIEVADEFLDEGVVVYVEGKDKKRSEYTAEDGKTDIETVVLVNENSASAAEILAAALQDNGFKLVGQTTFGKGVIQSTVEFDDGSALKLTIMQYFSPKGNVIHEKGVTPDYEITNPEDGKEDLQLEKALELLEK